MCVKDIENVIYGIESVEILNDYIKQDENFIKDLIRVAYAIGHRDARHGIIEMLDMVLQKC